MNIRRQFDRGFVVCVSLVAILCEIAPFPGSRQIADASCVVILSVVAFSLFAGSCQKVKLPKELALFGVVAIILMSVNGLLGFRNVAAELEFEVRQAISWLIHDRGIVSFFTFSDYYRNSLIYLRYALVPVYFVWGVVFVRCFRSPDKALEVLLAVFLAAIFINVVFSYAEITAGERITGLLGNPATVSTICLYATVLCWVLRQGKFLFIPIAGIALSFTFSAIICLGTVWSTRFVSGRAARWVCVSVLGAGITSGLWGFPPEVLEFMSDNVYVGSFTNRLAVWSVLGSAFKEFPLTMLLGLGAFPVFTDNVAWWMFSGFGVWSFIVFAYLLRILVLSEPLKLLVVTILVQGLLFPGALMPYLLITTFFLIGVLSQSAMQRFDQRGAVISTSVKRLV